MSILNSGYGVDTPGYLLSNEVGRDGTKKRLGEIPICDGGVHIGFSCWENLDIMAARKSSAGIIGDISQSAYHAMSETAKTVCSVADRFEFVKTFPLEKLKIKSEIDVTSELDREGSWLANDDSFRTIQKLFKERSVAILQLDIRDGMKFGEIQKCLASNGLKCDTLYLSNIFDWINESGSHSDMNKARFALNRVIRDDTAIIMASEHFAESSGLPQRVFLNCRLFDPKKALFSS
ncbi:MAG: hypothetical protein K1X28_07560 [Parachlamydiales bacterium]|nr:hypothetical protein [Parachlamydiales bacterium]